MEDRCILNPSSDVDVYCLHLVAKQLLIQTVELFVRGWNSHPVSTAKHFSPLQMFCMGLMNLRKDVGVVHLELKQVPCMTKSTLAY